MAIIFAIIGFPFAVIGLYFLVETYRFNRVAKPVDGQVHDNVIEHGRNSKGHATVSVFPVVNFFFQGDYYRFQSNISDGQERPVGSAVTVLIKDKDPYTARLKSSARYHIGVIFFALGAIFVAVGIHETRFSDFNFLARTNDFGSLAFLFDLIFVVPFIFVAWKIFSFIKKIKQAGLKSIDDIKMHESDPHRVKKLDAGDLYQEPVVCDAPVVSALEDGSTVKHSGRTKVLFALLGLSMLCVSLYLTYNTYLFNSVAKPGVGILVDYKENYDSANKTRTYCPVVEFTHPALGRGERFVDSLCSGNRKYSTGEEVPVLYDPVNSSEVRVDNGWMNYFGGGILFILGAPLLLLGLRAGDGNKK